jgi:hypothetical protein
MRVVSHRKANLKDSRVSGHRHGLRANDFEIVQQLRSIVGIEGVVVTATCCRPSASTKWLLCRIGPVPVSSTSWTGSLNPSTLSDQMLSRLLVKNYQLSNFALCQAAYSVRASGASLAGRGQRFGP